MNSNTIKLSDGRRMGYAEYGDPHGLPVLYCHGSPGSRWSVSDEMAQTSQALNIRMIAPDRPGYGLSDPMPERTLLDWSQDVSALINALGIKRFRVMGYSMGAPYALACAQALSERVAGVSVIGGLAPNIFSTEVTAAMPPSINAIYVMAKNDPADFPGALQSMIPDADTLFAAFAGMISEPDKMLMMRPDITSSFKRDCAETLAQGQAAIATDFILAANSWGFDLETIHAHVHIWNGIEDLNVPSAMAEYLAKKLPHNQIRLLPGEGHLCLFNHWKEILCTAKDS